MDQSFKSVNQVREVRWQVHSCLVCRLSLCPWRQRKQLNNKWIKCPANEFTSESCSSTALEETDVCCNSIDSISLCCAELQVHNIVLHCWDDCSCRCAVLKSSPPSSFGSKEAPQTHTQTSMCVRICKRHYRDNSYQVQFPIEWAN